MPSTKKTKTKRNLFQRLTKLFRSGPIVKRKIRALDTAVAVPDKTKSSGALLFQRSASPTYATITANAYNLSERLMRYQDFTEMEYCVSGDTLIATPAGYTRIDDLALKCLDDPEYRFVVYSYDHELRQIVPAWGKQARQTRVDEAWKVTLDSGKVLIATANHRFMLRDGTYCKVEDLQTGMAMMPFYRKNFYGYSSLYSMSSKTWNGWVSEHRMIAAWVVGRELTDGEVVHHINFVRDDNNPENLQIMSAHDHKHYHSVVLNGRKWSDSNALWIDQFKKTHSEFMKQHNPAERKDVTFGKILETCERVGFNSTALAISLDTDVNVIKRRLRSNGFKNFETFARAYQPNWKNNGCDNRGCLNPRYDHELTFECICTKFEPTMSLTALAATIGTTGTKIVNRLKLAGYHSWNDFKQNYHNHKVVSVEKYGTIPLYDLTVDGYKNFATDSVISHNTPEIASALDIYADEICAQDEQGKVLHVYSNNEKIRQLLEELFYNTLNVEFNFRSWARNLCKYGDNFLYIDVSPEHGVINVLPIPVNEIEREENYDRDDPFAVRFRWVTLANRILENWEVAHFRALGNDMFLPYGASIIEPARRIWRQLILIEDAMLVYRVVRAPERRVFYIDIANIPPENVATYVEQQRKNLRSAQVIDNSTGRVDLRYNPLSVDEDYFIPVRGADSGTRIETLAGGQNTAAIEDVAYIQRKLFAALKIPKAYLGYDEMLSSKATLAQEDIRFSRTISVLQKILISELNKIAIIHLYVNGYDADDLMNFSLHLSNPSTIALQQKLELWRTRLETAAAMPEGLGSKDFIRQEIWGLTDDKCKVIDEQRFKDKAIDAKIEALGGEVAGGDAGGLADMGMGGEEEAGGGGGEEPAAEPAPETAGELPAELAGGVELLTAGDDEDVKRFEDDGKLIKPNAQSKKAHDIAYKRDREQRRRADGQGSRAAHMPDYGKMLSQRDDDPTDGEARRAITSNPFGETVNPRITLAPDIVNSLARMHKHFNLSDVRGGLMSDAYRLDDDVEVLVEINDADVPLIEAPPPPPQQDLELISENLLFNHDDDEEEVD